MTIALLKARIEPVVLSASHEVSVHVRPLGGRDRLKAECRTEEAHRYVDFLHINAEEAKADGIDECFTWIFGEYAHEDRQRDYDSRRFGGLDEAVQFFVEWIVKRVRLEELPKVCDDAS